jgi:hypothetical protein
MSSVELAAIANTVQPGLLVTCNRSNTGEDTSDPEQDVLIDEIRRDYAGKVVAGRDLDIF